LADSAGIFLPLRSETEGYRASRQGRKAFRSLRLLRDRADPGYGLNVPARAILYLFSNASALIRQQVAFRELRELADLVFFPRFVLAEFAGEEMGGQRR
jgi:hypothetical protein